MTEDAYHGLARDLTLDVLHLDPENPRLPSELRGAEADQLLPFIAETYNSIEVARSITRHGYFASEPLIVIVREDGEYTVVEGNRRLVALRILNDPSLAEDLDDESDWGGLSENAELPETIPVVVAPSRREVAPIIGYRHISGIEPWDPYAKARFIASLVQDGADFEEVGNVVGERWSDVAAHYRNHAITEQASESFELDVTRVIARFGVFTRSMNSLPLRTFIGAPAPSEVTRGTPPLPADRADRLAELFSWLFGDDANSPVIGESRNITDLGTIIGSDDALAILRTTRDMESAFVAAGGLRERLLRRLNNALTNLIAATGDINAYAADEEVQDLLTRCQDALNDLGNTQDGN